MKTGLDIIGEVPWGTHFCQFYQTKDDLLEILIPYFKAGLEGNEFGMWVTADPLTPADAREAMVKAMPDFASYLEKGRIEILPHTEWYLKGGSFNLNRVLDGWVSKLDQAMAQGCSGMRVTGNTAWLERRDWDGFAEYETAINSVIGKYRMMALCTYWLDKCSATDVMDVIRNHEFALIRKGSRWEVIENAAYKQAQQALLESERKYRDLMESLQEGVWVIDKDMRTTFVNPHMAAMLGYTVPEIMGKPLFSFIDESNLSIVKELMEQRWRGVREQVEFEFHRKDGSRLISLISAAPVFDDRGDLSGVIAGIVDLTARERVEEELRESERRLNTAQEIAHLGSWELDLVNNQLTWSDEVYRIFGLQPQEFGATYEAFLDAVHPDDRAAVDDAYSNSLRQGKDEYEIEHRVVRKSNGEVRFVHEKCKHTRDESGRVILSVGMVHDITERKQAEEALRQTRDYLDNLLNYANAPIIVWAPAFRITRFNHAFEHLTGHKAGDVLGKHLDILFPKQSREESLTHIRRAMAGERWEVQEIPILRVDGTVRTVLWNSATLYASDGRTVVATIAQGQDITERKQAEEALRQTRDYLDNLLNYANAPIIVWDPAFRITRFNHAFERLTGHKAGEVIGKHLDILFPKRSREESLTHIRRAMAGERWEVQEIPILRVDGTVRTVLWNSATLYASDGQTVVATIAQGQDITERKQAEEEIKSLNEILKARAQALEAANTELEAFSYSVSHDLRGPLRSMDGFSLALLEDYSDELDAQAKDHLQRIRAASQFMGQLIDGILMLSRVTRTEIRWERVNLSELAESIVLELQGTQPERQVEFIIKPGVFAYGDATLLRLVVRNLLDNAWKFTGKVSCPRIEFGVTRRGGQTVYFVRDNGAGFDMAYADKLFTPFQRLHSEEDFAGTGIGLATLRRIINRHGGRIWGESEVGKGATFYFTLKRPSRKEIMR